MDSDDGPPLGAAEYDDLVDRLAAAAADDLPDRSRSDAVWDAVGDVVPRMTDTLCERVLVLADSEPDAGLVAEVTSERGSDDAEQLRARALTALVGDVETRLAADPTTNGRS